MNQNKSTGLIQRCVGNFLFQYRVLIMVFFAFASLFLAYRAIHLRADTSFEKMVPANHPYIQNYFKYETELRPLGNSVRIAVSNKDGTIYDADFLFKLRDVTDEIFYISGVDRGNLSSIWTPNVMWAQVTEEGLKMGPVIGQGFTGTAEQIAQIKENVERSGRIGSLVSNDQRSAVISAPLLELDPETGEKLDYAEFTQKLEALVREKYESDSIEIHITGFAKLVGDLIDGAKDIAIFFVLTFALTASLLYWYSRCWRSTAVTILCCTLAVIWHLGIMEVLGYGMDPYSILVPFLTFAIGVSHAIQNVRTMSAERYAGTEKIPAARATFDQLFVPGTMALIADAVGFSTLLVIEIGVIRELAISASIGVAVIIFTKMFLLPVLMSYVDVSENGIRRVEELNRKSIRFASWVSGFTKLEQAKVVVMLATFLLIFGFSISHDLKIGDLHAGAPELHPDSRYNTDVEFLVSNYSTSADVFVVMVQTPEGQCSNFKVATTVDRFQWEMENVQGVDSTVSLFSVMKVIIAAMNGGNPKWMSISRDQYITAGAQRNIPTTLYNSNCSMTPVLLFLKDHKAETLSRVVSAVDAFSIKNSSENVTFLMAAGNSGIEAATNMVVEKAQTLMLMLVYSIIGLLVFVEFRSIRITLAIMIPLFITEVLCKAMMVELGLGVKVATLPVIALGVGIGVDYGIYIYNRLETYLEKGLSFSDAYFETLRSTGMAIVLTAITLALGVLTWTFSSIKFQADMGLLLTFMFIWNMVGAIILIPALIRLVAHGELKAKYGTVFN